MIAKVHKLVRFKTLKQFNSAMEQWMVDYKGKFTKAEEQALKRLVRYACKYQGVAFARICKMLQANREIQGVNAISRSSFERMLVKAKRFGMLEVKRRKNGAFFVFAPYRNTIEVSKKEQLKSTLLSSQSFESSNKKQDDIYIENNKLLGLFKWKLKDKEVQHGSTYVQKTIETLFQYAETLLGSQDRANQVQKVLELYGNTGSTQPNKPNINWLRGEQEQVKYKSGASKWLY